MPARNSPNKARRGGRGGRSSISSSFSRFRRNSTPKSTPGPRSSTRHSATPGASRTSATPAPSRQSAIPAPVSFLPLHADADEDADALNEVVLAVDLRERGTVGCTYYVARDEKLYFMEDAQLGGVETIEARNIFMQQFGEMGAEHPQSNYTLSLRSFWFP